MTNTETPMPAAKKTSRPRLWDVDRAKGLAIMLVVFGHIVMREQPAGNGWYHVVRDVIYKFHMPFFTYLSGITMFYSRSAFVTRERYVTDLRRRAVRFLVPFVFMGLLIYFGKATAAHFMQVDHSNQGIGEGLRALFWNTYQSPATSLWYIFVMFLYYLIVPPLLWLSRGRLWPLLAGAAILFFVPLPEWFYLDKFGHFFVFLMLGGIVTLWLPRYEALLDRWRWGWLALFAASIASMLAIRDDLLRTAIIGMCSLPALHALVRGPGLRQSGLLLFLGAYCYAIYLFNTIAIGFTKGVMLHLVSWDGWHFAFYLPLLFFAGLGLPLAFKRYALKRVPALDRMTT